MKQSPRGFTLIELLVVIAIIALLSSIALASLNAARAKARDAQRVSDAHQLQVALELYYDRKGAYPAYGTSFVDPDLATLVPSSIPALPHDPKVQTASGGTDYRYSNGTTGNYVVLVFLEKLNSWCWVGTGGDPNNWSALTHC